MSEEVEVTGGLKEIRAECSSKPIAIAALTLAIVGALCGVISLSAKRVAPEADRLTTVEIVRLVNAADQARAQAEQAGQSLAAANVKIEALEKAMQSRMQEVAIIAQRLDSVAGNHNALVKGMQQEQESDKASIVLLERALMRLHGKPDWIGAVTAAQAEVAEEKERAAALRKKAEEAAKQPAPKIDRLPDRGAKVEKPDSEAKATEPTPDEPSGASKADAAKPKVKLEDKGKEASK